MTIHPFSGMRGDRDSALKLTSPCSVSRDKFLFPLPQSKRMDKTILSFQRELIWSWWVRARVENFQEAKSK